MLSPEDHASKVMAECVAKNDGENVAFYLAKALHEHGDERYAAGLEAAATRVEGYADSKLAVTLTHEFFHDIANAIRALGKESS